MADRSMIHVDVAQVGNGFYLAVGVATFRRLYALIRWIKWRCTSGVDLG
jgi:hypothetical protein